MSSRLIIVLVLASLCRGSSSIGDERVVDYAKRVDVAILDPTLKHQDLDDWLREVAPNHRSIQWRISKSCDGTDRPDASLCVRCDIDGEGVVATAVIQVGTRRQGIAGVPRLRSLDVPPFSTDATRLSDLPPLIVRGEATVANAKLIDVRTLDATLSSQSLDQWLRLGPMRLETVDWQVSGCDMKPIDRHRDRYPLCVKFMFKRGQASAVGIVVVGTLGQGTVNPARLLHAFVTGGTGAKSKVEATAKLARLPELLAKYQSTH